MFKMAPVKLSILKTLRLLLRPEATPDSLEKTVPETTKRNVRQNYSHYTRDTLCSLAFLTGSTYSRHLIPCAENAVMPELIEVVVTNQFLASPE